MCIDLLDFIISLGLTFMIGGIVGIWSTRRIVNKIFDEEMRNL